MKKKHPKNRQERRRSAEAKALELLKAKRIDGKKRKILVEIKEKETENELHLNDFEDEPRELPDRELVDGFDRTTRELSINSGHS